MKPEMNEQISAMVDGELAADEAQFMLRRCERDADLRATLGRYELIRSCVRREPFALAPAGFAADVMRRIDPASEASSRRPWLRGAAGALIAATVAAAALFVVAPRNAQDAPGVPVAEPTIAQETPIRTDDLRFAIPAQPASAGVPLGPVINRQAAAVYDPQLENYLIRHSEAASGSRGGFVPYVYVVSSPRRMAQGTPARRPAAEAGSTRR